MWYLNAIQKPNEEMYQQALEYQNTLTKPQGSLGVLEILACQLAARQNTLKPNVNHIQITIFAADHGIANAGVSAFPQVVTAEMVKNFAGGGAAITCLAAQYEAQFDIFDVGVAHPIGDLENVISCPIAKGTKDFSEQQAMSIDELNQALNIGKAAAKQAKAEGINLFIGGEMGIANTSSATAILCALLNKPAHELTGAGTGLDAKAIKNKSWIITQALTKHNVKHPLDALQTFGGFEIAALVGAYISCAQQGISMLIDGFICSTAALVAIKLNPDCQAWMDFSHQSAELGHQAVLNALNVSPLLNLNMRLGEGSGAAVCIGLLQSACILHNHMSTFSEAGVSEH